MSARPPASDRRVMLIVHALGAVVGFPPPPSCCRASSFRSAVAHETARYAGTRRRRYYEPHAGHPVRSLLDCPPLPPDR